MWKSLLQDLSISTEQLFFYSLVRNEIRLLLKSFTLNRKEIELRLIFSSEENIKTVSAPES